METQKLNNKFFLNLIKAIETDYADFDFDLQFKPHGEFVSEEGGVAVLRMFYENAEHGSRIEVIITIAFNENQEDGLLSFKMDGTGYDKDYTLYITYCDAIMQQSIDIIKFQLNFWI